MQMWTWYMVQHMLAHGCKAILVVVVLPVCISASIRTWHYPGMCQNIVKYQGSQNTQTEPFGFVKVDFSKHSGKTPGCQAWGFTKTSREGHRKHQLRGQKINKRRREAAR